MRERQRKLKQRENEEVGTARKIEQEIKKSGRNKRIFVKEHWRISLNDAMLGTQIMSSADTKQRPVFFFHQINYKISYVATNLLRFWTAKHSHLCTH